MYTVPVAVLAQAGKVRLRRHLQVLRGADEGCERQSLEAISSSAASTTPTNRLDARFKASDGPEEEAGPRDVLAITNIRPSPSRVPRAA